MYEVKDFQVKGRGGGGPCSRCSDSPFSPRCSFPQLLRTHLHPLWELLSAEEGRLLPGHSLFPEQPESNDWSIWCVEPSSLASRQGYSSGGQVSRMGFMGHNQGISRAVSLPGSSAGESRSLSSLALLILLILPFTAPCSHLQRQQRWVRSLCHRVTMPWLSSLLFSHFRGPCAYIGPTHIIQNNLLTFRSAD